MNTQNYDQAILILDDDAKFRDVIATLLHGRGLNVVEARSSTEANQVLSRTNIVLAIVDYRLPKVDGITWISQVRQAGNDFPIVFLSGAWCNEKIFSQLRNVLQVSIILNKPISPELFLQLIDSLLPNRQTKTQTSPASKFTKQSEAVDYSLGDSLDDFVQQASFFDEFDEPTPLENIHSSTRMKLDMVRASYAKGVGKVWRQLFALASKARTGVNNGSVVLDAIHITHQIKGNAGSLGFDKLGNAAAKIEDLLHKLDNVGANSESIWIEIDRAWADGELSIVEITCNMGPLIDSSGEDKFIH